jgi:histidinol-phosphate aminotransferase
MSVSRRGFLQVFGTDRSAPVSGAFIAARGLEAHLAGGQGFDKTGRPLGPPAPGEVRISSNENPLGPGKTALDAILGKFPEAGRYPFNSTPLDSDLVAALAEKYHTKPENVVMGAGSQEILRNAVLEFTSPSMPLTTAVPTFENPTNLAKALGHGLREIKVDAQLRLDVEPMIAASKGAGLVFFNNPNNPTATVHGAQTVTDFVERVRKASPDTVILIDEAYHDYVTDPSYQTAIPLALATPNVIVARTFSKAYGMAGMRIGYGIGMAETMKRMAKRRMPYNVSTLGVAAAIASLKDQAHIDQERARNTEVRAYTVKALEELGCKPTASQANFLFVDVHRPAKEFREACAKSTVMIGRDFPPFEKTHSRISIGTMDEMVKATEVFRAVLRGTTSTNGRQQ